MYFSHCRRGRRAKFSKCEWFNFKLFRTKQLLFRAKLSSLFMERPFVCVLGIFKVHICSKFKRSTSGKNKFEWIMIWGGGRIYQGCYDIGLWSRENIFFWNYRSFCNFKWGTFKEQKIQIDKHISIAAKSNITLNFPALYIPHSIGRQAGILKWKKDLCLIIYLYYKTLKTINLKVFSCFCRYKKTQIP